MSQSGLLIDGGFAPIMGVETIGTVSPEQSFMGTAANGWVGWKLSVCFRALRARKRTRLNPAPWVRPGGSFRALSAATTNSGLRNPV
jgi:hypothetical protein